MRRIRSVGIVAVLTSALLVTIPVKTQAQQSENPVELHKKANALEAAGRYAEAIPYARRALEIEERRSGPNHLNVAILLNRLALLYHEQGRYEDAEPLYQRSLAVHDKAHGSTHPDSARVQNNLAELYREQGRYSDAEALYKRSLASREKALGPHHADVAQSLNNMALLYYIQNRYSDAEPLYKRSLAIRERALGQDHIDVAQSLNNLGQLYLAQARYEDAKLMHQRALEIEEKSVGPNHPVVATSLNNLAAVYTYQSRYSNAERLYKRSLAILEKVFGQNHPRVALSLNNLARLYVSLDRYTEAESLYKQSLAIREKTLGTNHPDVAQSLNDLALIYYNQARYLDAEPLYKRSLAIRERALGQDHIDVAQSLNNLGQLYLAQGRYGDSELLHKQSLAILQRTLGTNHSDVGHSLNNLGGIYKEQGRYGDAEEFFKQSLATLEKALGPDVPAVANLLHNLAGVYAVQGRYADAEPLYKRALLIKEKALGLDHRQVGLSLNKLAELYQAQDRYADALPLVRSATQRGFDRKNIHLAILTGALTNVIISRTEALDESYEVVQRAMSSAASGAINQLSIRFAAGNDQLAQLVRRQQDLSAESESLDKILLAEISKEPIKRDASKEQRVKERLKFITTERDEIETSLNQRFPSFAALSKPAPISVADTQALVADDEALVAVDFDDNSYAWVVTRTDADWVGLKITAKELSDEIKSLRLSLTFETDKPFDTQLAFKIYQQTFGAIADKLQGKTRLSVVTNGVLTSLPLQLLVTKDPTDKPLKGVDWLVRSYAITNLPSVASLKTLRSRSSSSVAQKPMIAFADPIFSEKEKAQVTALRSVINFYEGGKPDLISLAKALPQLPDTANEVRAIGEVLNASKDDVKLGTFASETTVKQTKLDDYRIVYFATHGLVAGEVEKFAKVKAEPALALTIPDTPTELDDGLLTASEVAQLKLNADWVVLSACNTAAEGNPGAEALSGLARAFFYAGARSLVVSHWEVDSEATVQLMTGTFEAAARDPKLSHAEALRESMLSMLDNATSDDDAHPRIWAPFVVVGEPAKRK
jgi:CHAT domain-containing protein/Flp pilus assembly protein TadD